MKKIILLLAFLSLSCSGDDDSPGGTNCTEEARAGLMVLVKDAISGVELTEGVTVTATDGSYVEELTNFPEFSNEFTGAYERAGTYVLTVTKEGYVTHTSEPIVVGEDECHVIGEHVTVEIYGQD